MSFSSALLFCNENKTSLRNISYVWCRVREVSNARFSLFFGYSCLIYINEEHQGFIGLEFDLHGVQIINFVFKKLTDTNFFFVCST